MVITLFNETVMSKRFRDISVFILKCVVPCSSHMLDVFGTCVILHQKDTAQLSAQLAVRIDILIYFKK